MGREQFLQKIVLGELGIHMAPCFTLYTENLCQNGLLTYIQELLLLLLSCSVVSDSSRPHGLQPTRLLRPWGFPGKSTGVGCHCLLRHIRAKTMQLLEEKLGLNLCDLRCDNGFLPMTPKSTRNKSISQNLSNYLDFWFLFIFGCIKSSLLHRLSSSCGEQRLLPNCVQASHCSGFSWAEHRLQSAQTSPVAPRLYSQAPQLWHMGLGALQRVGSSYIREQTCVSCIGRQILYH